MQLPSNKLARQQLLIYTTPCLHHWPRTPVTTTVLLLRMASLPRTLCDLDFFLCFLLLLHITLLLNSKLTALNENNGTHLLSYWTMLMAGSGVLPNAAGPKYFQGRCTHQHGHITAERSKAGLEKLTFLMGQGGSSLQYSAGNPRVCQGTQSQALAKSSKDTVIPLRWLVGVVCALPCARQPLFQQCLASAAWQSGVVFQYTNV